MEQIRIAQIIGKLNAGGVEAVIYNYYRHLDHSKIQFDFFVDDDSTVSVPQDILDMGARVYVIPRYQKIFRYMKELKRIFRENQYQIVHSNMNSMSVFSLRAAKKAGVPVRICHSHSTAGKGEFLKNILKNILRRFSRKYATHYFACSHIAGEWLFGKKTMADGKVTIINNAIDLEKFRFDETVRDQVRREWGLNGEFVVGHVGRFVEQKNHAFLIDLFYELQKIRPDAKLLLIGGGPLLEHIKQKVQNLHLEDKVIFAGVQAHTEKFYNAMDCFVLPSLYEGLPVVGVEAQVNGLPCFLADTMTKETKIAEQAVFLSIEKSPFVWAKQIVPIGKETDRTIAAENLRGTKYDLKCEATKLQSLYEEMMAVDLGSKR